MTEPTEIDIAHAAMDTAPDDEAARLRFYGHLAESELFILLDNEPSGAEISPASFEVEGATFILVFDRIERLSEFAGAAAPYAALSGRGLAGLLAGQAIGWALNPEIAPSSILLPPDAVDWLAQTLSAAPDKIESRLTEITAPTGLPDALLSALDRKLATAGGLAEGAYLAGAVHDTGARGHLLAFVDAREGAEAALATAVNDALTFSGIEAGSLDVIHIRRTDPLAARLARVGLRVDLPKPETPTPPGANPGMNPDRPPRLR